MEGLRQGHWYNGSWYREADQILVKASKGPPKEVWYVAHQVSGAPRENAYKAIAWIKWLFTADPSRVYIAPWVAEVLAFEDTVVDAQFYDRVLSDDEDVVRRLDGVLMVGGVVSTGMARERAAAKAAGLPVIDWSAFIAPENVPDDVVAYLSLML